jgi:hypothetical protein
VSDGALLGSKFRIFEFHSEEGSVVSGELMVTTCQTTGCQYMYSPETIRCCSFYGSGLEFIKKNLDISVWVKWVIWSAWREMREFVPKLYIYI